jgi:hypothetical protein
VVCYSKDQKITVSSSKFNDQMQLGRTTLKDMGAAQIQNALLVCATHYAIGVGPQIILQAPVALHKNVLPLVLSSSGGHEPPVSLNTHLLGRFGSMDSPGLGSTTWPLMCICTLYLFFLNVHKCTKNSHIYFHILCADAVCH